MLAPPWVRNLCRQRPAGLHQLRAPARRRARGRVGTIRDDAERMVASTDRESLVDEVMWRGGIRDRVQAEAAIRAVVDAVAYHLPASDRAFVAEHLPEPYASAVMRPTTSAASRPSDLYAQLATGEEVSVGAAIEHARAACWAVGAIAGAETGALLARRLPPDWGVLFRPPAVAAEAGLPPGPVPGHGHTLATGRPGSSNPLAEAAPPVAQADSVVTEANPHGQTKLSSARRNRT